MVIASPLSKSKRLFSPGSVTRITARWRRLAVFHPLDENYEHRTQHGAAIIERV
jgi:hypothetical protein